MEAGHQFGREVVIVQCCVGLPGAATGVAGGGVRRCQTGKSAGKGAEKGADRARGGRCGLTVPSAHGRIFFARFWLKLGRNLVKTWSWLRKAAAWSPKARGRPAAVATQSGRRAESPLGALPGPVSWPGAPWLFSGSAGRADLSGRKPAAWRRRTRTAARSRPTAAAAGVGTGWLASPGHSPGASIGIARPSRSASQPRAMR